MTHTPEPLPRFLAEPSKIGTEISITGKWIPAKQGGLFRKSVESKEMLEEWEDIHAGARADAGVLSTEVNHAVGEDAVLVRHVFRDPGPPPLLLHHHRRTDGRTDQGRQAADTPRPRRQHPYSDQGSGPGEERAGGVRRVAVRIREGRLQAPDQETAIQVTAKWTCEPGNPSGLDELKYCGSASAPTHIRSRRVCSGSRHTRSSVRTP